MLCLYNLSIFSQQFTTNTTPVGMEHNVLFDATNRYTVTQTGDATVNLRALFDGRFIPSYSGPPASTVSPTTILIENLPNMHTQTGAWVGWSTRYWQPKRFKIEGYNVYQNANMWVTIADYSNQDYGSSRFVSEKLPSGAYTKLRYTIYSTHGADGKLGLSELFFIHPEATTPYKGLLASESDITWKKEASNTYFNIGNTGIGTSTPSSLLHINGKGGEPSANTEDLQNKASFILSSTPRLPEGLGTMTRLYAGIGSSQYTWFQAYNGHTTGSPKNISLNPKGGNVGIGTTTIPTDYKLAVAGKILTEEVKVLLQNNWPDYVFSKEYTLPSLYEVEKHINEKGHLQNIPSAKEVAKNGGIELGEMNRKLLEKIEELTLYTIQQQKEIERLKKLEERINKLENKN